MVDLDINNTKMKEVFQKMLTKRMADMFNGKLKLGKGLPKSQQIKFVVKPDETYEEYMQSK